jgi:hypothetical protein
MTRQRFEVFTLRHGDVVFTTRFRFVARLVTRFVRTLEYDYPIPLVPVEQDNFPDHSECPVQEFCECEACEHDCVEAGCGPVCKANQW